MTDQNSSKGLGTPVSRRLFVGSVASLGLCPLLSACEFVEVFDAEVGGEAPFDLSEPDFANLATVGGTACIAVGALELLLVRVEEDQVAAFERFCPHQQLDMGNCGSNPLPAVWDADAKHLICRWHRSIFDQDGAVVEWPDATTPRAIRSFPVDFDPASGLGKVTVGTTGGES